MSWSDVKAGDWVRASQNITDTEISGTVTNIGVGGVQIGKIILHPVLWEVQEVRKTYKIGDVGLLKSNGQTYIGIYAGDGYFYMHGIRMFKNDHEGIEVLKNVND